LKFFPGSKKISVALTNARYWVTRRELFVLQRGVVILLVVGVAIALLTVGLMLLGQEGTRHSTAPMNAIRFWLGIGEITVVLAICVLFLYALITG
jgi:hypothetical protein